MLCDGKRPSAMDSVEIFRFKTFWGSNFAPRTFSSLDVSIYMLQCYNIHVNSQLHWARYKNIHDKVNSELYKAKKSYFCDKFEDCAQTKDPKQSWHHINHLMGKNYTSLIGFLIFALKPESIQTIGRRLGLYLSINQKI